jgi:hypothetical protein
MNLRGSDIMYNYYKYQKQRDIQRSMQAMQNKLTRL